VWTYSGDALQQIVLRPDGKEIRREGFYMAEDDLNERVRWNKRLDAGIRK